MKSKHRTPRSHPAVRFVPIDVVIAGAEPVRVDVTPATYRGLTAQARRQGVPVAALLEDTVVQYLRHRAATRDDHGAPPS